MNYDKYQSEEWFKIQQEIEEDENTPSMMDEFNLKLSIMNINITKTIVVKEKLKVGKLKVVRTNAPDRDNTNLEIYYDETEIGYGQLNNRTNFAHVTINENLLEEVEECNLIDFLVAGIENRSITLY